MARIGFVAISHPDYLNEQVAKIAGSAAEVIRNTGAYVLEAGYTVTNMDEAQQAGLAMAAGCLDGVVLFLSAWVECSTVMSVLREVEHLPICLWGFPMFREENVEVSTGSYVSYAMLCGVMKRLGIRYCGILDLVESRDAQARMEIFVRCASARRSLMGARIGLVGYSSMSIYTGTFNHMLMRHRIGPEVCQFDTYELLNLAEESTESEKLDCYSIISKRLHFDPERYDCMIKKAAGLLAGMRRLVKENKLDSLCVKCQPELSKRYGMTACIPLSQLADMNVTASCEGDIPLTVTMHMMRLLCGRPVAYGDAITHNGNVVKLSACGFAPISMAACEEPEIGEFGFTGFTGLHARYVLRPGRVTVARLIEMPNDGYRLLYFTGEGLPTELRQGTMPALDVRIDGDIHRLVEQYNGQHYAIAYGDLSEELRTLADMLDIETVQI